MKKLQEAISNQGNHTYKDFQEQNRVAPQILVRGYNRIEIKSLNGCLQ